MSKRVGYRALLIIICIILTVALTGCSRLLSFTEDKPVGGRIQADLDIMEAKFHPANYKQFASYIQLGVYDGTLYMWDKRSSKLSQFEDGKFQKLCTIDGAGMGFCNEYFYYESAVKQESHAYSICSYHLTSGEHTKLATIGSGHFRDTFFLEGGKLYVPVDWERSSYILIENAQMIGEVAQLETYNVCGREYVLVGEREQAKLMQYDPYGNLYSYEAEIPYGEKSMIPCENGLLIHNETNGDFLYFIEAETGNAVELFAVDCIYALSAVNVHDGYAYLSFVRYTDWGPLNIGGKRDENDELNGTYRISLIDYSVEKISDETYNGLFIFDDTGIYACNADNSIYKLDFDGQRILTLLEH